MMHSTVLLSGIAILLLAVGLPMIAAQSCDFTDGFCGWTSSSTFSWKLGKDNPEEVKGMLDHSGNAGALFAYVPESDEHDNIMTLQSKTYGKGTYCFQFYYFLSGNGAYRPFLEAYTSVQGNDPIQFFVKNGGVGKQWHQMSRTISSTSEFSILISGSRENSMAPDLEFEIIAIDDILVNPGECSGIEVTDEFNCDFEDEGNQMCGFTKVDGVAGWKRKKAGSSEQGGVSDNYAIYPRSKEKSQLISDVFIGGALRNCLIFNYKMKQGGNGALNVYQVENVDSLKQGATPILRRNNGKTGDWTEAVVDLPAHASYRVVFESVGWNNIGALVVDDIKIKMGSCPKKGEKCTFEDNDDPFCYWTSIGKDGSGSNKWSRPDFFSVSYDHTLGSLPGHYLYSSSNFPGSLLLSKEFSSSTVDNCFQFWYKAIGTNPGTLEVVLKISEAKSIDSDIVKLWQMKNNKEEVWTLASVNIGSNLIKTTFQIQIVSVPRAGSKSGSFVAIDDTELLNHGCENEPQDSACLSSCKENKDCSYTLKEKEICTCGGESICEKPQPIGK